ncbi:hypothetical protein DXT90_00105 [Agrobacterium tumefaciens]|nr:hypothetical protein [Agrobacterium tumefaciens]
MSKEISIRFYGVERMNTTDPKFADVLKKISKRTLLERTVDCDGVKLRLEHLDQKGSRWIGEFTRIQTDDFPSEVTDQGRVPLSTSNNLGHSIVFCFDPASSIVAVRSDATNLSMKRIETYLARIHSGAAFSFKPKMRKDQWKEFSKKPLRSIEISLAGFTDLTGLDGDDNSAFQSLKKFSEGYSSHIIKIGLSMGHKKGFLDSSIKRTMGALLGKANDDFDIRSMKAKPADDRGYATDEINLLDQILADSDLLDLPNNDPDASFKIVCDALENALVRNKKNL